MNFRSIDASACSGPWYYPQTQQYNCSSQQSICQSFWGVTTCHKSHGSTPDCSPPPLTCPAKLSHMLGLPHTKCSTIPHACIHPDCMNIDIGHQLCPQHLEVAPLRVLHITLDSHKYILGFPWMHHWPSLSVHNPEFYEATLWPHMISQKPSVSLLYNWDNAIKKVIKSLQNFQLPLLCYSNTSIKTWA